MSVVFRTRSVIAPSQVDTPLRSKPQQLCESPLFEVARVKMRWTFTCHIVESWCESHLKGWTLPLFELVAEQVAEIHRITDKEKG